MWLFTFFPDEIRSAAVTAAAAGPETKIVPVKNPEEKKPDIFVRVSELTVLLLRHIAAADRKTTIRQILAGILEEETTAVSMERLEAEWLALFEDCLKADAIFLRDKSIKIASE